MASLKLIEITNDAIGFRCVKCPKKRTSIKAIKCFNCKNFKQRWITLPYKDREYTACDYSR